MSGWSFVASADVRQQPLATNIMRTIARFIAEIQWYIAILLALLVASVWGLIWLSSPVSNDPHPVLITVPDGATAPDIAWTLRSEHLIRSQRLFLFTARSNANRNELKPGAYELRRNMNLLQIISILVRGESASAWVTVPEGYTARQIAELLQERGIVTDGKAFVRLALCGSLRFRDIVDLPSPSLEGYLFPDTYLFKRGSKPEVVIREMLRTFQRRVSAPLLSEIKNSGIPRTPGFRDGTGYLTEKQHSVITLASLIEREAQRDKDRTLISSVIYNRLRSNMRLQIDATVQYALGEHRSRLYFSDYKTPSSYNTYLNSGLPNGPIANPGVKSIEAALHPAQTDYLYYVAGPGGYHVFSTSFAGHNRAVAEVRR